MDELPKISAGKHFSSSILFSNRCELIVFLFASELFLQSFLRHGVMGAVVDDRPVLFFDIDNCLYPQSKMVHDLMQRLINVCISPSSHSPYESHKSRRSSSSTCLLRPKMH